MEENKKNYIDWINDEQVRNNAESIIVAVAAIVFVVITKGFISGFSLDLFFTIEPYASGIGVGVATSLIQNNMLKRGIDDEITFNKAVEGLLKEIDTLDKKITDYDYAESFVDSYNKNEFARLQNIATASETRKFKYLISIKKSIGKNTKKLQRKLDYVVEYGAVVKGYKPVSLQDLLSFQSSNELKGKDKLNFNPVTSQQKTMIRGRITLFIASGFMAGLPLASGTSKMELLIFLAVWIPLLGITALRTYINSRKVTRTIYYKSLQYKSNVLKLCIDNYKNYTPTNDEPINKDNVIVQELIE